MKIISKKIVYVTASILAAAAVWGAVRGIVLPTHKAAQPGLQVAQPGLQVAHETVQPVQQQVSQKAVSVDKHVVAVQQKPRKTQAPAVKTDMTIKMIPVDKLLKESASSDAVKPGIAHNAVEKTEKKAGGDAADDVGLDIGKGLPLPVPESVLITPIDKPDGFHVGVDYHVDQKWDLTGLAGVTTTGGAVTSPMKPSVNQVGVRASYRF